MKKVIKEHTNVTVYNSGLLIDSKWTFIGASPDGIVCCELCNLEIKCPYCHRGESIASAASEGSRFCLQAASDRTLYLDHSHPYYNEVKTQLFISDLDHHDFCVCMFTDGETERIQKDQAFGDVCVTKVDPFTISCTLPEFLWKWYTKSSQSILGSSTPSNSSEPSTAT